MDMTCHKFNHLLCGFCPTLIVTNRREGFEHKICSLGQVIKWVEKYIHLSRMENLYWTLSNLYHFHMHRIALYIKYLVYLVQV